jgi:ABC-type glycerol-3-phosphate transport system substrate-binding protein
MTRLQGRLSPLARCNSEPEILKLPEFQVFTKQVSQVVPVPFTPGDDAATTALETRVQDAVLGRLSPDTAIHQAAQEAQTALDGAWRQWDR